MKRVFLSLALVAVACGASTGMAQESGLAKPNLVLRDVIGDMPRGDKQEIRVMTATFKPGDKTVFHTHRSPVTVYVVEGAFTLEMQGRQPVVLRAGEAMIEPINVAMTGYNRSPADPLRVVIFYVSDPDTPFLDPVK